MDDKEWTIKSIKSISDSQFGKKVQFNLDGYDNEVSCFTKFPENMVAGGKVYGHVEIKDGKWHNFRFGKKGGSAPAPSSDGAKNFLEFKVVPLLEAMADDLKAIHKAVLKSDYPVMSENNDASGF